LIFMRVHILLSTLFSVAVVAVVWVVYREAPEGLYADYAAHLRGNVFAGILSAGSFLLSLKTFIVVKLQENVYDSEVYKSRYLRLKREVDNTLQLYKPLRQLSDFLYWCIFFCLISSVAQVTLGFLNCFSVVLLCIFLAVFSGALVFFALWIIKSILSDWMDCLEESQLKKERENENTESSIGVDRK